MTYFQWDSRYDLGVDNMNTEHRGLVNLMNRLYDQNAAGATHAELAATLGELERATVGHFASEERYQASIGFPGLSSHKRIHEQLLTSFGEHKAEFVAKGGGLSQGFFAFLKMWLAAHIAGIDRKYADHAHKRAS
ncbi:MAG: hemerythrin family protein [Polyangiaceae bacterium]